jgi:hypothetical protein
MCIIQDYMTQETFLLLDYNRRIMVIDLNEG